MEFLVQALAAIPSVASSSYALAAFGITVAAWVVISWRVNRNRNLLRALRAIPPQDRARILETEMQGYHLPVGISPEQFLKKKIYSYLLAAFAITCVTTVAIVGVAVTQVRNEVVEDIGPPPIVSAQEPARDWLNVLEARDYSAAYDQMSSDFRAGHPKDDFVGLLVQFLSNLGSVMERTYQSEDIALSPPGAPKGWYKTLVFQTKFENDPRYIYEIIGVQAEEEMWKVNGIHLALKNSSGQFIPFQAVETVAGKVN